MNNAVVREAVAAAKVFIDDEEQFFNHTLKAHICVLIETVENGSENDDVRQLLDDVRDYRDALEGKISDIKDTASTLESEMTEVNDAFDTLSIGVDDAWQEADS